MCICTTVLYEYMNSVRNDVCNLIVNTHVRNKINREFYHCIIYIANEGRHVTLYCKVIYSCHVSNYEHTVLFILQCHLNKPKFEHTVLFIL